MPSISSFFFSALLWEGHILEDRMWRPRLLPMVLLWAGGCPCESLQSWVTHRGKAAGEISGQFIDLSVWTVCLFLPLSSSGLSSPLSPFPPSSSSVTVWLILIASNSSLHPHTKEWTHLLARGSRCPAVFPKELTRTASNFSGC